ncbi:restriction endonuclease subunit S [Acinetobacter pittii]|uniref:restriction endonuclease subunit S n=1 Tax=Acinetobacter pittii TaxID=48296 RepID=UPI000E6A9A2B|nr:restriction endonuclease subunit S [Acinetobacter pittii]
MISKSYTLDELCIFIRNGKSVKQSKDVDGLPITRIETIANQTIDSDRVGYAGLTEEEGKSHLLECGDILFSHINSLEHLCKTAIYTGFPEKLVHGMNLLCIRPNPQLIFPQYLLHLLRSSRIRTSLLQFANKSVNQASISAGNLKSFVVNIPPLAEQRRIASILDQADELRQKRQQAIEKLDELLQATFIDMFGDPVSNSKGWKIDSLNNYGSYKNGLNFGKGESGNQVLYIGVGDFKQLSKIDEVSKLSTIDLNELPSSDYFIKNGDLLFVRSNGNRELVGRCVAVYPNEELVTYSGFCIRYRIEKTELTSSYLVHLFRAKSFKQTIFDGGQGANIQNINQQLLSRLQIPIPPTDLQEKWSKILLSIEDQKQSLYKQLDMINKLFSSLQNQVFSNDY